MKRIICTALALMLCLGLFAIPVMALSANASLTGPGSVRAGETFTVTFSLNGSDIYGAQGTLSYDSNVLELQGTNQTIGNGWQVEFNGANFLAYDNSASMDKPINGSASLFTATFKVKSGVAAGTAVSISVSGQASDVSTGTGIAASWSATVAAPASADNNLKSLTVSNATISPAFSASTTSYTAEVPFSVSKLNLQAVANDSKAKVTINNPSLTAGGTTKVTVTVTAENGSTKTYTISVKRAQDPNYVASSNNALSGITVEGFLLSPVFSAENTQYVIWLPYETESVKVSATAADGKATVTVEGGDALIAGEDNEIKVICTAEDGTTKVYTIIAKRAPAHGEEVEEPEEPTEDPTEETTEPTTVPTVPVTEPEEPATATVAPTTAPQQGEQTKNCSGIPVYVLILVGLACLAVGLAAGIFVDKKLLNKK